MEIAVHNPNNLPLIDYRNLSPIQGNLKDLTSKNCMKLKGSFEQFGFRVPFFVWIPTHNETVFINGENAEIEAQKHYLLDGHQRLHVCKTFNITPHQLPYILVNADSFQEAKKLLLVVTSQYGTITQEGIDAFAWDLDTFTMDFTAFDGLRFFDNTGFVGGVNGDIQRREADEGDDSGEVNTENPYTMKVDAPIYEPKNEKPPISELYNDSRYNELINEINNSDATEEVKQFLRVAAARHIVFNYEKIADFYAHEEKNNQCLMENSALVIIDFNKAIELGYVRIKNEIAELYKEEYKNDIEDEE